MDGSWFAERRRCAAAWPVRQTFKMNWKRPKRRTTVSASTRALDQIRLCPAHRTIEYTELKMMCSDLGIGGCFDVAPSVIYSAPA